MLSLLKLVHEWRWLVPTLGIVVPAPAYYCVSLSLRALRPLLGRARVAALDDLAYDSYQSLILLFFETGSGAELRLSGEASDLLGREKTETVILLANHQSTMDWAVADSLAVRAGALGRLRYVLKSSLQYLPLYGWYFWLHGCIYVRRGGDLRVRRTERQLANLCSPAGPATSWVVLFPEGTRFSGGAALAKSQAFATARGFRSLNHVLFPRLKGAQMLLTGLQGKLDAVYDVTIAYSQARGLKPAPSMFQVHTSNPMPLAIRREINLEFATAPPGSFVEVNVKRWPAAQIPRQPEALQAWLYKRFEEKEERLSAFYDGIDSGEAVPAISVCRSVGGLVVWWGLTLPFLTSHAGRRLYLVCLTLGSAANILYLKAIKAI